MYVVAATLSASTGARAQSAAQDTTMNKVMVIENDYIPQISEASKINVVPKEEIPAVTPKRVEYATSSTPSSHIPSGTVSPMIGDESRSDAHNGYLRAGYGNYNNLDLFGNYLFILSGRDRINLNASAEGMNGKVKMKEDGETLRWKSKYYTGNASADYQHRFDRLDLNITGAMGLTRFNRSPFINTAESQRFVNGSLSAGVKSTDDNAEISYSASTEYSYYGRRNFSSQKKMAEQRMRTIGEVTGSIDEWQNISVALEMNNIIYNDKLFTDYTTLDLNPYYSLRNDDWAVRAGAHVDLAFGFGNKVMAAPDVTAEYTFADTYVAYIKATGGRHINDFHRAGIENPYSLFLTSCADTYEQLNGAIGLKFSPMNELHFNIYGGYQRLRDDMFSYIDIASSNPAYTMPTIFYNARTENTFAGIDADYSYRDIISLSLSAIYRNWKSDDDQIEELYKPLLFKPEVELKAALTLRPIEHLDVKLSYLYEKRAGASGITVRPVNDLRMSISYNFYKGVSIYANVNNILNKSYQHYYMQPAERLNLLGGLSFKF